MGIGFLVITLINSLTGGIMGALRSNFADLAGGHVFVTGEEMLESGRVVERVSDPDGLEELLRGSTARDGSWRRRSRAVTDVIVGSRTMSQIIDGVDFLQETSLLASLAVASGRPENILSDPRGIILPDSAVTPLRVVAGEIVTIRLSTVTGQVNVGDFVLAGTFRDSGALGISRGYVHLDALNGLLGLAPGECQSLALELVNPRGMNRVADELRSLIAAESPVAPQRTGFQGFDFAGFVLPGAPEERWNGVRYNVTTLDDVLSQLLALVRVLDAISLGVYLVLLAVSAIGITNSFRMIVIERTPEIGTMRALGMQRRAVRGLFQVEALMVTIAGVLLGGLLAALSIWAVRLIPLDAPGIAFFLRNGRLALETGWGPIARNVLIVVLMGQLAAVRPSGQAAAIEPAEALRTAV